MKVVGADDDFGFAVGNAFELVAPLAGRLHGGLHRLRARVHGQRHLETGQVVEFLIEQRQLIVAKGARCQRDLARLVDHGLQDFGMAVPLVDGGVRRQAIEIAIAFHVINPDPFRVFDNHVERMVVVRAVLIFECDQFAGLRLFHDFHKGLSVSLFPILQNVWGRLGPRTTESAGSC